MIENDPLGFAAAMAAMVTTVYLSRISGYWLIGRIKIGPRLRHMLDSLPGAVIAASVAPILIHGGVRAALAIAAAGGTMFLLRNDFVAVVAGVAIAAGAFALGL